MSFFKDMVEKIKDEDTTLASDGTGSAEFGSFIDSGSYILNAVLSGSLYGGVPDNKVTAFAGESATGIPMSEWQTAEDILTAIEILEKRHRG